MTPYEYTDDVHTDKGALAGVERLFGGFPPTSILDVGCGGGTWMRAARRIGVCTIVGIDVHRHVEIPEEIGQTHYFDLGNPFDLERKFDTAICFEVAEHLPVERASILVQSICRHTDLVYFSAAAPGQHGQNHVNCQWPAYWQELFNREGFTCEDEIRWAIWEDERIEPWYRQNIFVARRQANTAGRESRLHAVIHPEMMPYMALPDTQTAEQGLNWYARASAKALIRRLRRLSSR